MRRWRSWGSCPCVALVLAMAIASPLAAQSESVPGEAPVTADQLVDQGIAARRAGDDRAAVESFRRAYALSPMPRTAAQLGLAQQALGQWVEAHERLTEALAAEADPWIVRNREALAQALVVVRAEVGTVEVLVDGTVPDGARATLGGRDVGALPMERPIVALAGEEALEVTAPGHRTVRRDVRVRAGQLNRVTVELRPESDAASTSTASGTGTGTGTGSGSGTGTGASEDRAAPMGGDEWVVWVIVGAVAVVGVGVAVGVIVSQQSVEPPIPGTAGAVELLRF